MNTIKTVRILKTYGMEQHKVKLPWGIFDIPSNICLGIGTMSQCIHVVEDNGWILQSDFPAILGEVHASYY